MAKATIDPATGYSQQTKTYHSLRPPAPLPLEAQPLSLTHYTFSLLHSTFSSLHSAPFLIDSTSGLSLTYSSFLSQTHSLSYSLHSLFSLHKNDVAFILSPPSLSIPVLYFSLLSLGVTISPSNPLSSGPELTHQIQLSNPKLAFATSQTAPKLPPSLPTLLIDSPEFLSLLALHRGPSPFDRVSVSQSDVAAVLYSSGTSGKVKGVALTHRNFIALISGFFHNRMERVDAKRETHHVSLITVPMFHVFGFFMLVKAAAMGDTVVFMERFEFGKMLEAVERYRVTYMPVAPPLVVAFLKSEVTKRYDLSSLEVVGCGGAPLGSDVAEKFYEKFPHVYIVQGYGLTETGGGVTRMIQLAETKQHGSVGRLNENTEAKIVDPATGEALPPGQRGELWLRGPTVMKGYVQDEKATAEALDSEGWLKTGDLCYFDSQGFLYVVDRLKELIKYKAYQVPPAELEQLLQSHPEIADAAVIPFPDEEAGQIPMAYVVRKPGSHLTEAQVIDYITKQVAPYKKIRRVAFISSIPKSPAGKILRRQLVSHALSRTSKL